MLSRPSARYSFFETFIAFIISGLSLRWAVWMKSLGQEKPAQGYCPSTVVASYYFRLLHTHEYSNLFWLRGSVRLRSPKKFRLDQDAHRCHVQAELFRDRKSTRLNSSHL